VRAGADAMPLLTLAGRTEVVVVAAAVEKGDEFDGIDIDQHFAHHGADVKVNPIIREGMDVADVLVSYAAGSGADVIVMGRVRSFAAAPILDGATRSVPRFMTSRYLCRINAAMQQTKIASS